MNNGKLFFHPENETWIESQGREYLIQDLELMQRIDSLDPTRRKTEGRMDEFKAVENRIMFLIDLLNRTKYSSD